MNLAAGPLARPVALPPALARLGITPPALPAGWRGTMTVRIGRDAPITIPLGEQATVGLPVGLPVELPRGLRAGRPAAAFGPGAGLAAGPAAGGEITAIMDLLRRLIGQGRITRQPAGNPAGGLAVGGFPLGGFPLGGMPRGAMAGAPAPMAAPGPAAPAPEDDATAIKRLLALVNKERAQVGAGPLTLDPDLNQVAKAHSQDMTQRGFFGHDTPEGKKFHQRAAEAGTSAFAENIAGGQRTPEGALAAWLKSPGHRKNLLNPAWTRMGAGVDGGRWTQMFG